MMKDRQAAVVDMTTTLDAALFSLCTEYMCSSARWGPDKSVGPQPSLVLFLRHTHVSCRQTFADGRTLLGGFFFLFLCLVGLELKAGS